VIRVLITGASGFAGHYLLGLLKCSPKTEVFAAYCTHRVPDWPARRQVRLDLTRRESAREAVRKIRPHEIYHLSAQSIPRLSWQMQAQTTAVNTAGTVHLLEAVREHAPRARIMFASTNQVYGRTFRTKPCLKEDDLQWPENPYAATKSMAELACFNFAAVHDLDVVIARPFNHLGAGQSDKLVFSDWCRQVAMAEAGRQPPVLGVGNLDATRDFLHVEDVVRAYVLLMKKGKAGEAYNICTGRGRLLKQYVHYLLSRARVPMKFKVEKSRLRKDDPRVMAADPRKIRRLGWKPRKTALNALDDMLEYWRGKVRA
jgi:GDP-4-dehydro-6-deoxy-D-mannose reductase